jgi:NAD(P)-dependent dehydrogenase (short-subunit alcohol dehydrogenase family)
VNENPFDLTGKTALVTGASRGIGRAIALAYAQAGADLVLVSRSEDALADVAGEAERWGSKTVVLPCDVTDRETIQAVVATAIERAGHIDVAVNNAGGTSFMVPFADIRFPGWEKVFRLNVDSIVHVCQALGPHLLERRSGSVVNVASVAALGGTPMLAPYGASKAAVLSLTRTLAMEWAHAGVRVNALCPGWTATELNRNLWDDEVASKAMTDQIPMGRWGKAGDMVGPALLLASDSSAFLTGQALVIDGGQSAG